MQKSKTLRGRLRRAALRKALTVYYTKPFISTLKAQVQPFLERMERRARERKPSMEFELEKLRNACDEAGGGIRQLKAMGISFEEARVQMVCRLGVTMGKATELIESAERLANVKLDR